MEAYYSSVPGLFVPDVPIWRFAMCAPWQK